MIQVYKEGIVTYVRESEWQHYRELGYIKINEQEAQPKQEEIEPVDDFVVREVKKPVKKGKGK